MIVFMDIDIGDAAEHAQAVKQFNVSQDFFKQVGPQFGLNGTLDQLDADGQDIIKEAFAQNPAWKAKGPFRAKPPPALRAGRLVIELHDSQVPKAAENFKCLCTFSKGTSKASGKALHYKGCKFHRIVKDFVCQGGDFVRGDGSGGDSIYGGKFNDEKPGLKMSHDVQGIVGMANSGKNSNTSQFYITLAPAPQCDGKHVVIGRVTAGLGVLQRINEEAASQDGKPRVDVVISDCGDL